MWAVLLMCKQVSKLWYDEDGSLWVEDRPGCAARMQVTYTHHSMQALPYTGYVVPFKVRHAQLGLRRIAALSGGEQWRQAGVPAAGEPGNR